MKRKRETSTQKKTDYSPSPSFIQLKYRDLEIAIGNGNIHHVEEILKKFASLQETPNRNFASNQTPLHLAARRNNPEIIELLLNYGADATQVDVNQLSPAFTAAYCDSLDALIVLLNHRDGIQYNRKELKNRTILHQAIFGHAKKSFDYLIKTYGDDIDFLNAEDIYGETAIHKALYVRDEDFTKALLARRIDLTIKNQDGLDANQYALQHAPSLVFLFEEVNLEEVNTAESSWVLNGRTSSAEGLDEFEKPQIDLDSKIQALQQQVCLLQQLNTLLTVQMQLMGKRIIELEQGQPVRDAVNTQQTSYLNFSLNTSSAGNQTNEEEGEYNYQI